MKRKINTITLCSGFDAQLLALKRLKQYAQSIGEDIDVECVAWCEFDPEAIIKSKEGEGGAFFVEPEPIQNEEGQVKCDENGNPMYTEGGWFKHKPLDEQPAVKAHKLLHPESADKSLGDMTKVDWNAFYNTLENKEIDILTYSTPCTDISNAGLQKGFDPNSNTRSSILWDTLKCISVMKPKYLLQENVKAITSKKFLPMFNAWQLAVEKLGYRNYATIMNARDYGVPQNRERLFMLSVRDDIALNYRFPTPFPLTKTLEDVLEDKVDERYYVAQEKTDEWIAKERERLEKEGVI